MVACLHAQACSDAQPCAAASALHAWRCGLRRLQVIVVNVDVGVRDYGMRGERLGDARRR